MNVSSKDASERRIKKKRQVIPGGRGTKSEKSCRRSSEGRGVEKRIGGARETWGIARKRENKPRGRGKKSRRRKNEVKNGTKCGSTGEEKEVRQVRGRILEWYRNARGTGYRQRIDDVIPATRRIALRGASVHARSLRFDRDRDPSPGLRLPTGASANPAVQRVLSSASCVACASRDRRSAISAIGRDPPGRPVPRPPVSSEIRLRKKRRMREYRTRDNLRMCRPGSELR